MVPDNIEIDFLDEEETYMDQLLFDLDFDPKYSTYVPYNETLIDILNDIITSFDGHR